MSDIPASRNSFSHIFTYVKIQFTIPWLTRASVAKLDSYSSPLFSHLRIVSIESLKRKCISYLIYQINTITFSECLKCINSYNRTTGRPEACLILFLWTLPKLQIDQWSWHIPLDQFNQRKYICINLSDRAGWENYKIDQV